MDPGAHAIESLAGGVGVSFFCRLTMTAALLLNWPYVLCRVVCIATLMTFHSILTTWEQ